MQRRRAGRRGDRVRDAHERGEPLLELADPGALRQRPGHQGLDDEGLLLGAHERARDGDHEATPAADGAATRRSSASTIRSAACPSPNRAGRARVARHRPGGGHGLGEVGRLGAQPVPAGFDGLDPFGLVAQGHAWHAGQVRLFLDAARVGGDDPRMRLERDHVAVAGRLHEHDAIGHGGARLARGPPASAGGRGRGPARAGAAAASHAPSRFGSSTFDGRWSVMSMYPGWVRPASGSGGSVAATAWWASTMTSPTMVARSANPSRARLVHGRRGGSEKQVGQVVGHDPIPLLRHVRVEGAEPGLHVRQPRPRSTVRDELGGGHRAGEGGVRVAVDDDHVRHLVQQDRLEAAQDLRRLDRMAAAADLEIAVGRRQLQVAEEDRAHRVVVVLPGVDQDFAVAGAAQDAAHRGGLDELGTGAHDREDLHLASAGGGNGRPQLGHGPANGAPSVSLRSGSPHGQACPIARAGLPTTSA